MADRSVHYEAAFEAWLRRRGVPYVAVDEAKKALFTDTSLKSFDFVVYNPGGANLLVDIKGRRFRTGSGDSTKQTWATEADVADLGEWERVFGDGFVGVLVFAYWIDPPLIATDDDFGHRDRFYQFFGVELREYRERMRPRSAKWKTVSLRTEDFHDVARPLARWL
jgi:hypothetical protein